MAALLPLLALASTLQIFVIVSYTFEAGVTIATIRITITGKANTVYAIEVRGPGGEVVAVREVVTDSSGVATLTLEIPDTYPAGRYMVYVSGDGENATETFDVEWDTPAEPGAAVAAGNLIRVASRLSELVHCRKEVLAAANVTQTEYAGLYQHVLNLTSLGDAYLSLANGAYAAGDYATAFRHAQAAIQSYGAALELQEFIARQLNIPFAACRFVLAPVEPPAARDLAANRTCKWRPEFYPMMTAFDVTERRIEELEKLAARAAEQGYNVSEIISLLEKARSLVEEGRSLAVACNESAAAHRLAEAKRLLGLANAALARLGTQRLIREMMRRGVEVNETEVEEVAKAVRNGRAAEKIFELINRTLNRIRERVEREARIEGEEALEKRLQKLDELLEKLPQRGIPSHAREIVEKARETARRVREEVPRRAVGRRP